MPQACAGCGDRIIVRNRFWTSETTCTITDCRLDEDTSDCPAVSACRCGERTAACSPTIDRTPRGLQGATPGSAAKAYHRFLATNSPGSHGVTSLTGYPRALMASLASPDAPTCDLQPNPTSPSPTISHVILVPSLAQPSSTTHQHTLCTLRNVSHIAHCTITHLIPSPPTLSIRPGVISRVSVAALCPILPCIAFHILHAKSHLKGGGAHARRLLKVRGSYHEFSNASSRGYPFDTGYSLGIPRVPKSDCFGFWDPNATGFTPGTPGSPGDNF